jgi:hypothetical protein
MAAPNALSCRTDYHTSSTTSQAATSVSSQCKQHPHRVLLVAIVWPNGARRSEEKHFDGSREAHMQRKHNDKQNLRRLGLGGAKHGVQVSEQEGRRESETEGDEDEVEN